MRKLNIVETNALATSFVHYIHSAAGGKIDLIEFTYLYYGRFVDMGVGRGVSLITRDIAEHNRQQKPWYSRTFFRELNKLTGFLAENYGEQAAILLKEGNRGDIELKM